MRRSMSSFVSPAAAMAWSAATAAMSDESTWAILRSLMPERVVIHSSEVSMTFSRSELPSTAGGTHFPQPVMVARRIDPSSSAVIVRPLSLRRPQRPRWSRR